MEQTRDSNEQTHTHMYTHMRAPGLRCCNDGVAIWTKENLIQPQAICKINARLIRDLNVKAKTIQFLHENVKEYLYVFGVDNFV